MNVTWIILRGMQLHITHTHTPYTTAYSTSGNVYFLHSEWQDAGVIWLSNMDAIILTLIQGICRILDISFDAF